MRRTLLAAVAAALLLAIPLDADADTHRIRASTEWEAVRTELVDAAADFPAAAAKINQAIAVAEGGRMTLEDDLFDVVQVFSLARRGLGAPPYPAELVTAFDVLVAELARFTALTLADFEDEIDTFEAAFPDKSVKKQRKALEGARKIEAKALARTDATSKANELRKAILKVRKVKTFPYVKNPPKGCPPKLSPGETASWDGALFDFKSQTVEPYYFEANWGSARVTKNPQGVPTYLSIDFGYCNGRNTDLTTLTFGAANPVADGVYGQGSSVGGLQRGPGFGINLTAQSTMTITLLDLEQGIVGGSFIFNATNGAGGGTGSFLLLIDPPAQ